MQGKSILLIIGGGIAAYKCLDFIRRAKERGAKVRCILTAAAQEFVTPLSAAVLSGEPAFTDLFDLKNETEIGHIRLSREADLIVVAPATADLLAKIAHGLGNDLASTVLLAADKPVLAAPAMNWRMWENPATRRNLAQLKADGIHFVGPNEGAMACNEWGVGRMAEADEILAVAARLLTGTGSRPLTGRHVLVTAGPTFEPIDPVRFIGNRSSGKQGYAIAVAAARLGARVTLVAGPSALADPVGVCTFTSRQRSKCWMRSKQRFPRTSAYSARRWRIGGLPRCSPARSRRERPRPKSGWSRTRISSGPSPRGRRSGQAW